MLRRRQINSGAGAPGFRSTVATAAGPVREAAWAVEERVVWGGADVLKGAWEVAEWPFERLAWLVEERLLWPLQERVAGWSAPRRAAGAAALALVAFLAGALGLAWASNGSHGERMGALSAAVERPASQPSPQPVVAPAAPVAPTLHGAAPVFVPPSTHRTSAPSAARAGASRAAVAAPAATPSKAAATGAGGEVAEPAAVAVGRRFADAFVLYETGQADAGVSATFRKTATGKLAASLLHRPPRLPANVEVPQAKVLNVVPGPQLGNDCTVSVSLLRVGIASELRLSMHRLKHGAWQVEKVLG